MILIIRVLYLFEPHLNTPIFKFFVFQEVQTPTFEIVAPLVPFVCAIISSVSVPACRTCSHLCSFVPALTCAHSTPMVALLAGLFVVQSLNLPQAFCSGETDTGS